MSILNLNPIIQTKEIIHQHIKKPSTRFALLVQRGAHLPSADWFAVGTTMCAHLHHPGNPHVHQQSQDGIVPTSGAGVS